MVNKVKEELKVRLVERIADKSDMVLRNVENADNVYALTADINAAGTGLQYLMTGKSDVLGVEAIEYMHDVLKDMLRDKYTEIDSILRSYAGQTLLDMHRIAHNECEHIKRALNELDNLYNLL